MRFKVISSSYLFITVLSTAKVFALPEDAKPAQNQVLNISLGGEPKSLDPQKCYESECGSLIMQLFEGLVKYDDTGNITASSAERWEVSPDGKKYTFYLRKNLKWSEGSKVTASDFVYAFQRLLDPKTASGAAYLLEYVVNGKDIIDAKKAVTSLGVKAIDDHTLEINLRLPIASFIDHLTDTSTFPVQKNSVEKYGDSFTDVGKLISNGAYQLIYRKVGDKLTLARNPNYWNNEKTYLEKVNFYLIEDQNTQLSMYGTGQIDITREIPENRYQEIKAKYGAELIRIPFLSTYCYVFNTQKPPLNDKNLRKALSIAIDREVLTNTILEGVGHRPLYDPIPYGMKNYQQNKAPWQDLPRKEQLEMAKKLYKEAGYSEANPLKIQILYNTSLNHKRIAIAIASMWKQNLGVNAVLQNEEWKSMINKKRENDFQVMRMGYLADVKDVAFFYAPFRSNEIENDPKYKNPEYDTIVNQALEELNLVKRKELFEKAGRMIIEDVPFAPIYSYMVTYLAKPYINGFKKDNLNKYTLSGVYILDKNNKVTKD